MSRLPVVRIPAIDRLVSESLQAVAHLHADLRHEAAARLLINRKQARLAENGLKIDWKLANDIRTLDGAILFLSPFSRGDEA